MIIVSIVFVLSTAGSAITYYIGNEQPDGFLAADILFAISGVAFMMSSVANFFVYWHRLPEFRRAIVNNCDGTTPVIHITLKDDE